MHKKQQQQQQWTNYQGKRRQNMDGCWY